MNLKQFEKSFKYRKARIANPRHRVYLFSSARNYSGQDAVLEIELIPHELKAI